MTDAHRGSDKCLESHRERALNGLRGHCAGRRDATRYSRKRLMDLARPARRTHDEVRRLLDDPLNWDTTGALRSGFLANQLISWRARRDSNSRPLPSECNGLLLIGNRRHENAQQAGPACPAIDLEKNWRRKEEQLAFSYKQLITRHLPGQGWV